MTETEFITLADQVYRHIEQAFDDVDPDVVECEMGHGTVTLIMADGKRWVLSRQPPVRQLWLAVASRGRAYHFDYDPQRGAWMDDKGEGLELMAHLRELLREETGLDVAL